ncbi:MAG: error-prone DNA polymerase [Acidimicrobiia bacterium]
MGFNNPNMPWGELEARLSGKRLANGRAPGSPSWNAGGDGPAWSRKRQPFEPPVDGRSARSSTPYAELHCHSNFSFLDGASHPEELAEEAARLGLEALALTDHDGLYGVVRFAEAARAVGLPTVFGAEITLARGGGHDERVVKQERATERQVDGSAAARRRDGWLGPQLGEPDPHGEHLVLLADGPEGYARLSRSLSLGHLAGEKGAPRFTLGDLADSGRGHWWALTGCRKGSVPAALEREGPSAARRELRRLVEAFGRERVVVELWDHGDPLDSHRNDALVELALSEDVMAIATNNVHYATPARRPLATALAAVRARRSLDEVDPWLPAASLSHLRSGAEQARHMARYPGVVEAAAALGRALAFDLSLVAPSLPPYPCPDGLDEMAYLRQLAEVGGRRRYGERHEHPHAWSVIDHELAVIEHLGFPGYFLVVWDIVDFCRRSDIYCQGRGSAANSAVCYALGITKADAVGLGLLFERFLSPQRDGPPDIDIDIESDRREEVIQYVYDRYGRHHTAQVANVITYRARSSVRDIAKAFGFAPGQQDAWSKQVDAWGRVEATAAQRKPDGTPDHDIPASVLRFAAEVEDFPRHLGIHSGGMVICDRPVIEVCPVEWARMDRRSVLQWDKDDCAATGLVKFDLLGLGMLSALHYAVDLIREHRGYELDLATIPQEDEVYEMLCRADTVGVFQIESRAQMATLPRLRPRTFYDLVVEVALIRPGPIQGGSVHPYIRRRNGQEPVTYLHPLLENSLAKTLGVPLFQEQLMQMAIDVAGFSPAESDQLRQAMGSKRSRTRMERLRLRLYEGMAERGIEGAVADELFEKMAAFANYGFPESHSVSFAYLVYASSWIKYHEPAAFCAALLNAQPMGFWSPHSLVRDARRHDVVTRTPDLNASAATATLEPCPESHNGVAVRLGLGYVRGIGTDLAKEVDAGRPYASIEDLVRCVGSLQVQQLEALATAGVFGECFGLDRRAALWAVGAVAQSRPDRLPGIVIGAASPRLPGMDVVEEAVADLWSTGIAPDGHPTQFIRDRLDALGVVTATGLWQAEPGTRVLVGGVVTHRQRPMTAQGTTFMNLEDETGLMNIVISRGCWTRHRRVAREAPALLVRGRLERSEGVINIVAEAMEPLPVPATVASRDFH